MKVKDHFTFIEFTTECQKIFVSGVDTKKGLNFKILTCNCNSIKDELEHFNNF